MLEKSPGKTWTTGVNFQSIAPPSVNEAKVYCPSEKVTRPIQVATHRVTHMRVGNVYDCRMSSYRPFKCVRWRPSNFYWFADTAMVEEIFFLMAFRFYDRRQRRKTGLFNNSLCVHWFRLVMARERSRPFLRTVCSARRIERARSFFSERTIDDFLGGI